MTTRGSQLLIDPNPLILIETLSPGFPASTTCRPATFPCKDCPMFATGCSFNFLASMDPIEPVRSLFFIVP